MLPNSEGNSSIKSNREVNFLSQLPHTILHINKVLKQLITHIYKSTSDQRKSNSVMIFQILSTEYFNILPIIIIEQ